MARRRYRKNEGLLDLAVRSDWKFSAALATACVFAAKVFIPAVFGHNVITAVVGAMFIPLAWLMALIFGAIAVIRFLKQQHQEKLAPVRTTPHRTYSSGASTASSVPVATSDLDKAWPRPVNAIPDSTPLRPPAWSLKVLDKIEWKRFEDLCCAFYREKGIRAETTALGPDGGVDIRLFQDDDNPTRPTAIVQCKALSKAVGVKPVRELRGVMAHEKVEKAFFMAPNGFTDEARAFAAENRITLLEGKHILAMLQRLPADSSERLLALATEGDWTVPTCPDCGARMVARDSKRGAFWGCPTYPRCRGTLPMRKRPAVTAA